MKKLTIPFLLFLLGCNPASKQNTAENEAQKDTLGMQEAGRVAAEPGTILFETNEILNKISNGEDCRFEYAEQQAPNIDIVGETSYMEVEVSAAEAKDLIGLFYKKCYDSKLEAFDKNGFFTPDIKYDLKAYFNIAGAETSYFTCIIKSKNKYAYYVLGNP
jgi:hypothetical protein